MRRLLAGVLVAIAVPGAASSAAADVFVPADPAMRHAICAAAAGDVVVGTRIDRRGRVVVDVTEAAGRSLRRAPLAGRSACPDVAVASDGGAVIAASSRVWVRRPGGRFGPRVPVGSHVVPLAVSAAPGGWVGVVGERVLERQHATEIVATIIAPDGTVSSAIVARGRNTARRSYSFRSPEIGVDAHGAATVVWTRWEAVSGTYVLRIARASGGGTWSPAHSLGTGADPVYNFPSRGQVDVAVAPTGHTLVAWADGRGMMAAVDAGPAERVSSARDAGSPTASIGDDGAGLVAYARSAGGIFAVDRAPGSGWSAPHVLAAREDRNSSSEPAEREVASSLAPDGRAVVAWIGVGEAGPRVFAAPRLTGGAWSPSTPLSAITHDAASFSLALGAAGDAHLVWTEATPSFHPASRIRGARLAPDSDAEPMDAVAPHVTTRLPRRTPRTGTGVVRFRIPLRCSEACDARVRLVDTRTGGEVAAVVRELPARRRTTVRLRTPDFFANAMLVSKRARRPRIEVLATDRAGNVRRVARTVRVRVLDRPLLSFRVAPDHDFAMFTRAGNRAVARLVNRLITALASGEIKSFSDLRHRYLRGARAIAGDGHDEIYDTEVGDEIFTVLEVPCARAGYDAEALLSG